MCVFSLDFCNFGSGNMNVKNQVAETRLIKTAVKTVSQNKVYISVREMQKDIM